MLIKGQEKWIQRVTQASLGFQIYRISAVMEGDVKGEKQEAQALY